jgi:hypothetical protein
LEQIAFSALEERLLGPPSDLLALLTTSKTINFALSPGNNNNLYARIFALKFDTAALSRRLTRRWLTTKSYATELRRRFEALKRIRHCVVDGLMVQYDLWAAFFILLEHDHKNALQLAEWAKAHIFASTVARRWLTGAYGPQFGENVGALVCAILWELMREGQLCKTCVALDGYFDTSSTPAELTEVWRRGIQVLLYTHVVCGYQVCDRSVVTPMMSLTDAIVYFILCLRGVLRR